MTAKKKKPGVCKRAADGHMGVAVVQRRVQAVQTSLAASYCEGKPPPPTHSSKPLLFAPSPELGMFWAGMLKQVMFTCTSKAINNKPVGLRWVCRPSHLGLTSWKHLASFCHNSIQIHFGLPQAPPVLVEVIPDYRATVVKCWYNVFFFLFFHSACLCSCSGTAGHLVVLHFHRLLCAELMSHFRFI